MAASAPFLHQLFGLDDQVAVVIGGTGVLGGALCEGIAQAGARVVVAGRSEERGHERVQAIEAFGGEATFLPEANLAVNRTSELVLSAKVPKDLDALLKTLSDLKQRREDVTSDVGKRALAKVEAAFSVVTHWQDYLANLNAGNMKAAHEALRPIAEAVTYPVIPRSEILTRMTQLEPPPPQEADPAAVEAIFKKMQTLEDIGPALLELNKIGFGSGDDRAGYELYRSLKKLNEL